MFLKLAVAKCTVDFMSSLILSSLSLIIKFTQVFKNVSKRVGTPIQQPLSECIAMALQTDQQLKFAQCQGSLKSVPTMLQFPEKIIL